MAKVIEVDETELRSNFPVGTGLEVELGSLADDALDAVVGGRFPNRDRVVTNVGDAEEKVGLFGFDAG